MTNPDLYFKQIPAGPMANYVYFVGSKRTRDVLIVDAAWDIPALLKAAEKDGYRVKGVLVSHYHPDHVGGDIFGLHIEGLAALMAQAPVPIYVHKLELPGTQQVTGLSASDFKPMESGDTLQVGDVSVEFIHTPGHTPGSQCFLVDGHLISGDTLFIEGCGRVDLPGANPEDMYYSLTQKLARLPDDTLLFPGHNYGGQSSNIGQEKQTNPYMKVPTVEQWLSMMGRS